MGRTARVSGGGEQGRGRTLALLAAAGMLLWSCAGPDGSADAGKGGGQETQGADSADVGAGQTDAQNGDVGSDGAVTPDALDAVIDHDSTDASDSAETADADATSTTPDADTALPDTTDAPDGDAALPDTPDTPDAPDAQPDAPTVDACAPYQGCFQCKAPGADEPVSELPLPATCDCDYGKPKFFKDEPIPAATLTPTIGYQPYGEAEFVPYKEGGWVGLFVGPQLAFHIWLGLRLSLPQETQDIVKIQVEAAAFDGPKEVATNQAPVQYAYREAPGSPFFRTSKVNLPGSWIQFPVSSLQIYEWCNRWLVIVARVRVFKASAWGESKVMVRTFANAIK